MISFKIYLVFHFITIVLGLFSLTFAIQDAKAVKNNREEKIGIIWIIAIMITGPIGAILSVIGLIGLFLYNHITYIIKELKNIFK